MSTEERRAPGATRIPFEALVEVGGALGPTFEAQAVNVSEEGIHLRTAYLPEPGQPLTCRFDAGPSQSVLASGEVAWSHGAERGGEFGVRFTEVDAESVEALKRICGMASLTAPAPAHPGSKVRLHIDGLASPMRAKIRDAHASEVTVGSDLGFLQVGRQLELEDTQSGAKRPANIDRVAVTLDPASNVPQLVVTLRYADASADAAGGEPQAPAAHRDRPAPRPSVASADEASRDDLAAVQQASLEMKGAVARAIDRVGPAVGQFAERAKTMVAVLAQRGLSRGRATDAPEATGPRRTTAPPPGGGLHAEGRRVVRGETAAPGPADFAAPSPPPRAITQRRLVLAGGVMAAAILGALALKKGHHEPAPAPVATAEAAPSASALAQAAPSPPASPVPSAAAEPGPAPVALTPAPGDGDDADDRARHHRVHVAPFANGPVHHGNVLRLKMDGAIESIEGAQQPTGFTVKLPGRKAVEPAAPLAARDARIAAIKVTNENAGADLTVAFKDGVPNYRVSARGDTLVISLAPPGTVDAVANKDEHGGTSGKHTRRSRTTRQEL